MNPYNISQHSRHAPHSKNADSCALEPFFQGYTMQDAQRIFRQRFPLPPLLAIPALLLGCMGAANAENRQAFETAEYRAQGALAVVNASALYARGGTGEGVTVALIDSGLNLDLPSFKGRIADPGYDYVLKQSGTLDRVGHGTQMAGVLAANKDERGMHGIAYDAQLIPMRFGDNNEPFFFDEEIAGSWRYAFERGAKILSNSWANSVPATELTEARYKQIMEASLQSARDLVAQGAVFVFPTGNELKREPLAEPGLALAIAELEKGWLAVVALKRDGTAINAKSNYCGVAARWCIAVPGGDAGAGLLTTGKDGKFVETAGTSPAVALVAGALAALQSRYPDKSPQQLRERLLSTANKTGIYANTEAYGQGLMDLDAASRP